VHETGGVADGGLLPVLVLDPDLHDHACGAAVPPLVLDDSCTVRRSPA
jgi:hypothetical protein